MRRQSAALTRWRAGELNRFPAKEPLGLELAGWFFGFLLVPYQAINCSRDRFESFALSHLARVGLVDRLNGIDFFALLFHVARLLPSNCWFHHRR